jgi:hypothetical protein
LIKWGRAIVSVNLYTCAQSLVEFRDKFAHKHKHMRDINKHHMHAWWWWWEILLKPFTPDFYVPHVTYLSLYCIKRQKRKKFLFQYVRQKSYKHLSRWQSDRVKEILFSGGQRNKIYHAFVYLNLCLCEMTTKRKRHREREEKSFSFHSATANSTSLLSYILLKYLF